VPILPRLGATVDGDEPHIGWVIVAWPYALPATPSLSRGSIDRAAERRTDEEWLGKAWESPDTRVLVVDDDGRVAAPPPDAPGRLRFVAPTDAPDGERYLLGVDDSGAAVFAVRGEAAHRLGGATLRDLGAGLPADEAGLLVHAVALAHWHARHQFCPRCGEPTVVGAAGHTRVCTRDGSEHYPRTDPAMIVLVLDEDDRALLAHHRRSPAGGFTTLAGFVEPGESLEQCVRREVAEEASVVVEEVVYAGSQPWPFPASLMLGCYARGRGSSPVVDGDEVIEAHWFTREELRDRLASGAVRLPPRVSIARLLVEGWFGTALSGDWK